MNDDLISRSALKDEINSLYEDGSYTDEFDTAIKTVFGIIDTAPTVEPFEPDYVGAERLKARQRGYTEGYHNGMEIGKTLNPKIKQGEWIFLKANEEQTDGYECSVCKRTYHTRVPYFSEFNFCPNCGADMRGDDNG